MVKFIDHSDDLEKYIMAEIPGIMDNVGMFLQGEAGDELENSPRRVDTGRLKLSINWRVVQEGPEYFLYVGTNVKYAIYVHEGTGIYHPQGRQTPWVYRDEKGVYHTTRGMLPNRFLKNACLKNQEQIKKYFQDGLRGIGSITFT